MLTPNLASILSGLLLVSTVSPSLASSQSILTPSTKVLAAPAPSPGNDVTATKRSLEDGKPPYAVHLYIQKNAATADTITCDNYEQLYAELLKRNQNWDKDWPGSFGWINSNVPKKGKGKREVQFTTKGDDNSIPMQPTKRDGTPTPAKRSDMTHYFRHQVFKDGPVVATPYQHFEDVHGIMLGLNPNFDQDFPAALSSDLGVHFKKVRATLQDLIQRDDDAAALSSTLPSKDTIHTRRHSINLNKRYDGWATPLCNRDFFGGKADYNHINELMDTLLMQNGTPKVGAGPKKCAMAGCKDGNSIWFCNDVSFFPYLILLSTFNCKSFATFNCKTFGTFQ